MARSSEPTCPRPERSLPSPFRQANGSTSPRWASSRGSPKEVRRNSASAAPYHRDAVSGDDAGSMRRAIRVLLKVMTIAGQSSLDVSGTLRFDSLARLSLLLPVRVGGVQPSWGGRFMFSAFTRTFLTTCIAAVSAASTGCGAGAGGKTGGDVVVDAGGGASVFAKQTTPAL